ncbi:MAG TPA: hypothetical protein PLD25_03625 [Chloroflexota bacterium]|nr:hypothetical protein [Chloroflexota bacterium]
MKQKSLFLILMVAVLVWPLVYAGKAALEEPAFNQAQSNQVAAHDHSEHEHVEPDDAAHGHELHDETAVTTDLQVVLVPSELAVGQNRMAVGLLAADNSMVHQAQVHFRYFDLSDPGAPQLEQEADAYPVHSPDGWTTIYAQDRSFDRAGEWGLEVQARLTGGQTAVQRIKFNVSADSRSILPGEAAPRLHTPTLADVNGDFSRITSAWEPNPAFYQLSLDEALQNGKPTVLLLATPAFCQTRFCGPAYEIVSELEAAYGHTMNFIHVEVYAGLPDPSQNGWELSPVMAAFGLETEPWVYVMDAAGLVIYRAEGVFTAADIMAGRP